MSNSKVNGKEQIKAFVDSLDDVQVILDIGCGSATYPKLLAGGNYSFIGIEIFEPYIKKFDLNDYYDEIIVGDAGKLLTLPLADLIIFGDVLEHMEKESALELILKAIKSFEHVIISIPVTKDGSISPAEIHYQNIFEAHISGWTFNEIKKLAKWKFVTESGGLGIFYK